MRFCPALRHDKSKPDWDIDAAIATYNVDGWGDGYFSVNGAGNVAAKPLKEAGGAIDLLEVVKEARERGLGFPLVIRFQDLLRHRVETINRAFQAAMQEFGYRNDYRGVFPIKVNQLREVMEEIVDAGAQFHFGIEAGSKPELIAALAMHKDPESLIICNGYKDRDFIRTAHARAEARQDGHHRGREARGAGADPARLEGGGRRADDRHPRAAAQQRRGQVGDERRREREVRPEHGEPGRGERDVESAQGSRIASSSSISTSARRCRTSPRSSARCARRPAFTRSSPRWATELGYLDVGGGLGVDYDGSRTTFDSSTNYSLQEYCSDIVYNIMEVCDSERVAHPAIVSEGGRAIVAHHSVLVVEAFGAIEKDVHARQDRGRPRTIPSRCATSSRCSSNLKRSNRHRDAARRAADQGGGAADVRPRAARPRSKAKIETLYWQIATQIVALHRGMKYVPEEVKELETSLGDQYICNFSVFQSLLDHWALGQLFPIMPIHRLTTPPDRQGTLVDITCDSDGKVSKFIDLQDVKDTLPLHRLIPGEMYYLGFFLVGAYQDIMGDLHNLFGRVNEVHVFLDEDEESGWYIEEMIEGSTIGQVLALTQWDKNELMRLVKPQVDAAIKSDRLKPNEAMKLLADYERGLQGYTYLSLDGAALPANPNPAAAPASAPAA